MRYDMVKAKLDRRAAHAVRLPGRHEHWLT
jgi:hypothetical protein